MLVVLVVLVEVNLLVDQGVDMRQVQRADLKLVDRQILVAVVLEQEYQAEVLHILEEVQMVRLI